jgi:branched-chain amino acid transport system permease protein
MTDLDRAARSKDVAIGLADMGWGSTALFGSCQLGGLSRMPVRLDLRLVPRALLVLLGLAVVAWIAYKGSQDSRVFWIVTLNGLTLAALFFVVSAGFTLIFGLMRVVNMAHGSLYLLAGYIAFTLQGNWYGVSSNLLSGTPATITSWVVPMIIATIVIGVAGVLMQQVFLRWNQGQDLRQALITIAISVILADQMVAHFGGIAESIQQPAAWPDSVTLFGVRYGFFRLEVVVGAALLIGALLFLVIKRTRFGMIIRAGVDDRSMVSALGVNIQLVFAGAFFVGALLAGLAGVLGGTMIAVQPGNDSAFLLDSLIVVIIGGMGSLLGAAIGSVALGLVSAYADVYLKFGTTDLTNYAILLTFILVVAVLAVRPLGLFGRPA